VDIADSIRIEEFVRESVGRDIEFRFLRAVTLIPLIATTTAFGQPLVLVIVGPHSHKAQGVLKEVELARKHGKDDTGGELLAVLWAA
jgi:hypothetical protein